MNYLYYGIIVLAVILALIIFILVKKANQKLKKSIIESFGKIPNQEKDFDSIKSYYDSLKKAVDTSNHIDDITWSDLDMDKVFARINSCHTSIGEEYLYSVLHEPNLEQQRKREKLISFLKENSETRLNLQMLLAKFGKLDNNGLSSLMFNKKSKRLKFPVLYKILAVIPLFAIGLLFYDSALGLICLVASSMINGFIHYFFKLKFDQNVSAVRYFSAMLWSARKICALKNSGLKEHTIELEKGYNIFKPLRARTSRMTEKGTSDLDYITDYFKILFLSDLRKYNKILDKVYRESQAFHAFYKAFGEIDLAVCILSYRESLPVFCVPKFHEQSGLIFDDVYHPLLLNPIPNSGAVENDSLVTGPNASGKSTFIKALAVGCILAQTINTCTAAKFTLRPCLVMTSMAVSDSITKGESYFITEIKSLKRIIDKIDIIPCTCFIDEILRGTNTIERIAASSSLLRFIHDKDCLCIAASHDIELTQIMKKQYDNYHFRENVSDDGVSFDFKLQTGAAKTRNAIKLLAFMGFDKSIVDEANGNVDKYLSTKKW